MPNYQKQQMIQTDQFLLLHLRTIIIYFVNQTLLLDYKGVNHEPDNTFTFIFPSQKTLMLLDDEFTDWVLFKDFVIVTNVPGFVQAHDSIRLILMH